MPRYAEGHTLVLSNVGYDANGPYLRVNDVMEKTQMQLPVLGRTFSVRKLPRRYCTGSFDLKTYESHACEFSADLPDDYNDIMCPACREKTGFNPAFYNANSVSPQQRAYNTTPHFVYMAYFSPAHLKVGISSETRGIERLLEQGARVAAILRRFPNADAARELEAYLCAQEGIYETMRLDTKTRLLSEIFNPDEAMEIVANKAHELGIEPECGYLDLTPYYFGDVDACPRMVQVPEGEPTDVMGGRCVGMVGGIMAFEQQGTVFVSPIKDWESYELEITVGEVVHPYTYEPQQMNLW